MSGGSYFHVGLIVPKLEPALAELTALLGITWRDTFEGEVPVHLTDTGEETLPLRLAYSQEHPYLEVIEGVAGTPWALSERGSNLHHLGFYVEDLASESERVTRGFCPAEVCGLGPGGERPVNFSYHARDGLRIELVDVATRAFMFGS
jgi:hypothetical protein